MQERYLFKAKRISDAQWIEGYLIYSFTGVPFIITEYDHILAIVARDEIDPETICQCTGLKDKNGNLIWENDIMEAHLYDKFPEDATRTRVVWDKNAWVTNEPGTVDREYLDEFYTEHFYVIGNVFDNPKLVVE